MVFSCFVYDISNCLSWFFFFNFIFKCLLSFFLGIIRFGIRCWNWSDTTFESLGLKRLVWASTSLQMFDFRGKDRDFNFAFQMLRCTVNWFVCCHHILINRNYLNAISFTGNWSDRLSAIESAMRVRCRHRYDFMTILLFTLQSRLTQWIVSSFFFLSSFFLRSSRYSFTIRSGLLCSNNDHPKIYLWPIGW